MTELKLTSKHSGSLQPLIESAISLRVFSEQAEWGAIANYAASPVQSKFWIASLQGSDRATGSFEPGDRPQTQLERGDRGTR